MPEFKKRETAYKIRIGDLLRGNQIFDETPQEPGQTANKRLLHVSLGDKKLVRINIIANVIEKYQSEGERRFASLTIDDGSGQIRIRVFGEDINKFDDLNQGDTLMIIGVLRSYNQELYILPEIIRKQDPRYLLVRKLEIEKAYMKLAPPPKEQVRVLRDQIIDMIKNSESNEGVDTETIILTLKSRPDLITQEIKKLLEEGIIYEPKPGRLRYLG
ncbi:MAG: OB-fold nucleic acid binding domain-containing protein [Candidatus Pacearchaeota archaeon]